MAQADFSRISTNIAALNTLNSLRSINNKLGTAQLRLATGKRINQASDDPAGLTIALKMLSRSEGLKTALGNIGDAKNMLAVAESGLGQISEILIEMKAKATAAASETLGTDERSAIKLQMESLGKQINDIVAETQWNGGALLDGTVNKQLQTGAGVSDQTTWALAQNHSATDDTGLSLGTSNDSIATVLDTVSGGTSFDATAGGGSGVTVGTDGSAWLAELATGKYEFEILGEATDATHGKATKLTTDGTWNVASVLSQTASVPGAGELDSGTYSLKVISKVDTAFKFEIRDEVGTLVAKSDADGQNLSTQGGQGANYDLNNEAESSVLGINITNLSNFTDDETYDFEYIKQGEVKVKMSQVVVQGGSETITTVAVDADGSSGTVGTRSYFHVSGAAGTFDTGRGFTIKLGANLAAINAGETSRFDLTAAGAVTITLATASDANTLMGTIDGALTNVTTSLNGVGSLVARLDKKETAVSVSQVNTEAAYNRIMNADMAYEQVQASKYQILQQTAMAMLSQANMAPQGILSLFR